MSAIFGISSGPADFLLFSFLNFLLTVNISVKYPRSSSLSLGASARFDGVKKETVLLCLESVSISSFRLLVSLSTILFNCGRPRFLLELFIDMKYAPNVSSLCFASAKYCEIINLSAPSLGRVVGSMPASSGVYCFEGFLRY